MIAFILHVCRYVSVPTQLEMIPRNNKRSHRKKYSERMNNCRKRIHGALVFPKPDRAFNQAWSQKVITPIIQKGSRIWSKNGLKWTPKRFKMDPWSALFFFTVFRIEFNIYMKQKGSISRSNLNLKIDENSTSFFMRFLEASQRGIVTIFASTTTPKMVPFRNQFRRWRPCDFAAIYYTLERFWPFSWPSFSSLFLIVFQICPRARKSQVCIDFEVHFWTMFRHLFRC